jgi:cytochrome c2
MMFISQLCTHCTSHAGLEGLHHAASQCKDLQRAVPLDRWDVDAWCAFLTSPRRMMQSTSMVKISCRSSQEARMV